MDDFKISDGNLEVLKRIPEMMTKEKWRKKIRKLVMEYVLKEGIKPNPMMKKRLEEQYKDVEDDLELADRP